MNDDIIQKCIFFEHQNPLSVILFEKIRRHKKNDSKTISIYIYIYIHRVRRRVVEHLQVDPPRKQICSSFKYRILVHSFDDSG